MPEPRDPLEDVFESGGELFLAIGSTPGGAPFGPRVEIVDGELAFPDESPLDIDSEVGPEDADSPHPDSPSPGRESPFERWPAAQSRWPRLLVVDRCATLSLAVAPPIESARLLAVLALLVLAPRVLSRNSPLV